jgi:formylmethanofuran dehydrogenase subunit E
MKDLFNTLADALRPELSDIKCDSCNEDFKCYELININHKLTCGKCYKKNK